MKKISSLQKYGWMLFLAVIMSVPAISQRRKKTPPPTPEKPAPLPARKPPVTQEPEPYDAVITDKTVTQKGLFCVHQVADKWYFEIGDSLMGRDILVVNRIARAPADTRVGFNGYAGDEINENVIRFEKGPGNKVFLRKMSFSVYAKDSTRPMYKSVMNSNIQPIEASFPIKAFSPDSTGVVIDLTNYINSDNDILYFAPFFKNMFHLGGFQADKSYIASIKTYPLNTEIRTVKTYSKGASPSFLHGMPAAGPMGNATFELNSSIVLLPKNPMHPRYYDDRVAYFTTGYTDFDADPQGVKDVSLITRWRLQVKPEDMEKFKRGELVEPVKPIVFYIDPATPTKWVPYLIQGVNDWQKAFEKAGFKNAIMAKPAPTKAEDSTWSLEDARYSAIVYKPSEIANASGPNVHDPRSGEILESHINWYHNVMHLLRDWYIVQASPSDPRARKPEFDDSLMGELIRVVSSHEVGHTLGLPHNMGSSWATPVEKLRDKAWVEAHGHTASIMDYARFNYVAQPGDSIGPAGLLPRIGDYDKWAIEWGYRPIFDKTEKEEKEILNKWVEAHYNNPRYRFIHQDGVDPRAQTECLGDDNMKAGEYGIRNLKWILPQLPGWLDEKGENYSTLAEVYGELVNQYNRYMGQVVANIGGIFTDTRTTDQPGPVYTVVPRSQQKAAMDFLGRELFRTPSWLLDKDILDKIVSPESDRICTIQDEWLEHLLNISRMQRLISSTNRDPAHAYTLDAFMSDLEKNIWSELPRRKPIDNYRRNLQKSYVEKMGDIIHPTPGKSTAAAGQIVISFGPSVDPATTDIVSVAKATLRTLRSRISAALPGYTDRMSRYHLEDMLDRINEILKPKS